MTTGFLRRFRFGVVLLAHLLIFPWVCPAADLSARAEVIRSMLPMITEVLGHEQLTDDYTRKLRLYDPKLAPFFETSTCARTLIGDGLPAALAIDRRGYGEYEYIARFNNEAAYTQLAKKMAEDLVIRGIPAEPGRLFSQTAEIPVESHAVQILPGFDGAEVHWLSRLADYLYLDQNRTGLWIAMPQAVGMPQSHITRGVLVPHTGQWNLILNYIYAIGWPCAHLNVDYELYTLNERINRSKNTVPFWPLHSFRPFTRFLQFRQLSPVSAAYLTQPTGISLEIIGGKLHTALAVFAGAKLGEPFRAGDPVIDQNTDTAAAAAIAYGKTAMELADLAYDFYREVSRAVKQDLSRLRLEHIAISKTYHMTIYHIQDLGFLIMESDQQLSQTELGQQFAAAVEWLKSYRRFFRENPGLCTNSL